MEEVKLDVQIRQEVGGQKIRAVRRADMIPGVVYGGKEEPAAIKFDRRSYEKIRRQHHGEVVFHLTVLEGDKKLKDYSAIVKEEQHHFVSGSVVHVDFKRISLKEKISVKVPLTADGEPIGVRQGGGSLDHILWELDITCLPMDIPEDLKVDVTKLEIGQSIHVKDLVLPAGLSTHHDPEAIVFTVVPPRRVEEEQPAEAGDAEPELIKKKEKEGAAGDGATGEGAAQKKE